VTQVEKELVEIIDVEKVLNEVVGASEEVSSEVVEPELRQVPHHVLVADDSAVARKQVKRVLDQLGIESTLKNNGADALEQLKQWASERTGEDRLAAWLTMVISDIEMPKMDGYSLTKKIREDVLLNDLHVILHSSLSGVFNEAMVRKVGANHFLAKYDPDELAKMVQEQVQEHDAEHGERVKG
jgi:two-component system chemotaxis response regulator CheV